MSLMPGIYTATIQSHGLGQTQKGTPFVRLALDIDGNEIDSYIYLSDKSMGMARAALKKCGFNPDEQELKLLRDESEILKGNEVQVEYDEDEQYGPQAKIVLSSLTDKKVDQLTQGLRNVKKKKTEKGEDYDDLPF